jgi:hypothetical protein
MMTVEDESPMHVDVDRWQHGWDALLFDVQVFTALVLGKA